MRESVEHFREQYREQFIGPRYSGWAHFAFTVTASLSFIAVCIADVHAVLALEWLTIPLTFLYVNFAEYFGHREPKHHPRKILGKIFERHTRQHHRFFTEAEMAFGSSRDFKAVLFPHILIVFFLFAFGTPIT